jgi:hypothetical protein
VLELVDCKHCGMSGTCRNGINNESCAKCVSFWQENLKRMPKDANPMGMVCSVCWGKGLTEPSQSKWEYRFPAALAIVFVALGFGTLLTVFLVPLFRPGADTQHFDKVLVFVSTPVGSVTGYYFGGQKAKGRVGRPAVSAIGKPVRKLETGATVLESKSPTG